MGKPARFESDLTAEMAKELQKNLVDILKKSREYIENEEFRSSYMVLFQYIIFEWQGSNQ